MNRMRHDYFLTSKRIRLPAAILGLLVGIVLGSRPAEAQYSADFQTNVISGVASNWGGYYYVGDATIADVLVITNNGVLSSGGGRLGNAASSSNNSVLVSGNGSVWTNTAQVRVGNSGSGNSLVISNGGEVVILAAGVVGSAATSSNNSVLVSGSGSVWTNTSEVDIGSLGFGNSLVISSSGTVFNSDGYIGKSSGADNNSVLVTGTGSVWTNTGNLNVGYDGSGNSLVISNSGTVFDSEGWIGISADSNSVLVTGSGSVWNNSIDLYVGYFNSGNSLVISDGGTADTDDGAIGYGATSSSNSVLVTGSGSVWTDTGDLKVGYSGIGNSLVISNGGTLVSSNLFVGYNSSSSNNLVTLNGGNLTVANALTNGVLDVRQGTFTMNGGTNIVDTLLLTNGSSSVMVFNGGTLITKSTTVSNGAVFTVGDGAHSATLTLADGGTGVHSFNDGLVISSNATLNGIGTIIGTATVSGTLSPGFSVGTITISNDLVLSSSSVLQYDLGSNSDLTVVSSNLTLDGTLNITDAGGFTNGTYTLFTYGGTLTTNGSSTILTIGTTPDPSLGYTVDISSNGYVILNVGLCTYALSTASTNVAASAGSGSVGVTTSNGCPWTAVSSTNWLHTSSSGTGNGTVSFTVDANTVNCGSRTGTITVVTETFTVYQAAGSGSYALSASSTNVAASASSGSVGVTASNGCPWTAASSTNWLHTTSSGTGNGTVSFTVDANTVNCGSRTGTITVATQTFTVNQAAGSGTYVLSASSTNVTASAGSGSVGLTASNDCPWTAVSSTNWLHTTSSGTGNGTVSYTFDANPAGTARSGTITVGGQTFTVSQPAGTCTYALSAASTNVAASAGSGSVDVTAGDGCSWTAVSSTNWLHTTSSGTGTGTVSYTVDANSGTCIARSGTITVGGQTFTVNQAAGSFALSAASTNVAASAGSGSVGLTASNGCPWTAVSSTNWLHTSSSGTGNGTVSYTVDANTGNCIARSGTITVGGQTFTVNQAAGSGTYALSAASTNVAASAGSGSVGLTAGDGCSWTAVSSNSWLHTTSSGTGNGTVSYTFDANTGTNSSPRTGTMTIAGQTFTVTQAGNPVTLASLLGTYNGLAIQTNAPSHGSSGSINLVLSKTGSFAANLTMGGVKSAFKGQFDTSGNATNTVTRKRLNPLQVILHLDVVSNTDTDGITGTVSEDGTFTSELLADRAVFNRTNSCPWAGTYTVVLVPPDGSDPDIPQGYGYGTLKVTTMGGGKLTGVLGDGTKISVTVPLSKYGTWPLYNVLYRNQGSCIGWVTFATNNTLDATVDWFRPPMSTSHYYPAGFTTNVTLIGDKYVSPSAGGPSAAGDRQIALGGGNLVSSIVKTGSVDAAGNVTVSPPNSENLQIKLQTATGQFSGSFTHPLLNKRITFKGLVLQIETNGAGYFLGTNESGYVTIEPVP